MNIQSQLEKTGNVSEETGAFDRLLEWLDPDRDRAGMKYLEIEKRLMRFFTCRGCPDPANLINTTFDRVEMKIMNPNEDWVKSYMGDPAYYFLGVARYVHKEYCREMQRQHQEMPPSAEPDQSEQAQICLDECLKKEPIRDRKLILDYYREDRRAKIDYRKELAEKMGIELNALRIQACRIRKKLRDCIEECLENRLETMEVP